LKPEARDFQTTLVSFELKQALTSHSQTEKLGFFGNA
jgi:hypothetical protein